RVVSAHRVLRLHAPVADGEEEWRLAGAADELGIEQAARGIQAGKIDAGSRAELMDAAQAQGDLAVARTRPPQCHRGQQMTGRNVADPLDEAFDELAGDGHRITSETHHRLRECRYHTGGLTALTLMREPGRLGIDHR